jgi:alpha-D-ribose 1-methylphosphonate 5-triphosphate synthase subunit PhnI
MYVATKGGEAAIEATHELIAEERRGDTSVPELAIDQVRNQLGRAVDRVMTEGSLYDPDLAALAIKQAQGDMVEAIFLLRAFRTTLPRFGATQPIDTSKMIIRRRISAAFKDVPGGQILGPTYDYTHRLLDFGLAKSDQAERVAPEATATDPTMPRVTDILGAQGLMQAETRSEPEAEPFDLGRQPMSFPADRDQRLQNLFRGDEGFVLALGYATQRGYGRNHPFVGEIRMGFVEVVFTPPELGFPISIGTIEVTECQMINQFQGAKGIEPMFTRGYGLAFGQSERKTMAMALVDRALKASELGEDRDHPPQDEEFVLAHSDNVEAAGFVSHLKLPHYVDFQSELSMLRGLRADALKTPGQEAAE